MDHLQKFISQVRSRLILLLILDNLIIFADWWVVEHVFHLRDLDLLLTMIGISILTLTLLPWVSSRYITQPTRLIWQAILHIAPDAANVPAPNLKKDGLGHDLVANLVAHVYQLASVVEDVEKAANKPQDLNANFVANTLPLPLMILDKNQNVLFANKPMLDYLGKSGADLKGQNAYAFLDLSFAGSEQTFDTWLENAKANTAVATKTWERVRLNLQGENTRRQLDMAAYYNKSNPNGFETMLVFFDHPSYEQDDQALSFVALAVHELRTPITLLRGYIEVLEEEMAGKMTPEMEDFMHKMKVAAQSLTAFINNMLNVARIENDQLMLKLHEEKWGDIVQTAVSDLGLRAKIQGVTLETRIDPKLPTVGADRVAIYEVLVNLVDNAIKYSGGPGKKVTVSAIVNKEGMVETTVQDNGAGIPASILPNLFEKFYRSHRSRNQVGGTGLGLYLSKAIIDAHHGNIWVRSQEGEGSTFGFTVQPYTQLAAEQKNGDNNNISRGAHGWIKNHSLYSR
jgi:signal transduction histidine kinase